MNQDDSHLAREGVIFAANQAFQDIAAHATEPCVLYRPALSIDGDQWCALYGDNLQDGVAGFGPSPAHAMQDFNRVWYAMLRQMPQGCHRSHPHENMNAECERKTLEARQLRSAAHTDSAPQGGDK
jgi:hypothetical protein